MRPATPKELRCPSHVGPSSPPHTPTAMANPPFFGRKTSSLDCPGPSAQPSTGPQDPLSQPPDFQSFQNCRFNFAFQGRHGNLSPRSSDPPPEGSEADESDGYGSSRSPLLSTAPGPGPTERLVSHANIVQDHFIIEELSDFGEDDMEGRDDVLAPHVIEYAGSEWSESHIDGHVINNLRDLKVRSPDPNVSSDSSELDDDEHQKILQQTRADERRKRQSIGSVGKRTMSERSDSDHEDVRYCLDFDQVGSSARRMKRRIGDRRSLSFPDPPPRIDEIDEPPEEMEDTERLAKELPFYSYVTMEVDSP